MGFTSSSSSSSFPSSCFALKYQEPACANGWKASNSKPYFDHIPWNSIKDPGIGLLSSHGDRVIEFHFHSGGIGLMSTQEIVHWRPNSWWPINWRPINWRPINGRLINGWPINGWAINGRAMNWRPINWRPIEKPVVRFFGGIG